MTVWLVILVPLVLFAWLVGQAMPSPRDRQLVRLRQHARSLDLNVAVRALPDPDPDAGARVDSSGRARDAQLQVASYSRALRPPRGVEKRHLPVWRLVWMRHHAEDVMEQGLPPGWRFERAGLPLVASVLERLSALLDAVPKGTVSLEGSHTGVTLNWRERGSVDEVDAVAGVLDGIRDLGLELAREAARSEAHGRADPDAAPEPDGSGDSGADPDDGPSSR